MERPTRKKLSMPTRSPKKPSLRKRSTTGYLRALLTLVLTVGILYVAKPVIVPIALAVLLAFILNPLVTYVERWRIGRVPSVLLVVMCTLILFGAVGYGVGTQLAKLADDLPTHKDQITAKINRVRGNGTGALSRLMDTFRQVSESATGTTTRPTTAESTPMPSPTPIPPPTIIAEPKESAVEHLLGMVGTVLAPIADAGLILILVIFLLIRREDLRNRVIGLLGHGRLTGTTRVLVGSAEKVSQLLLMQLAINGGFAVAFALALLLLGVPYWFLWGSLTMLLRFVPYVGTWMAASLPILLSIAISPGWGQPLAVLGVFVALDLTTANVVEPLLLGHSTGVSPVALLVAAVFWTWVWGTIGLVLSTPLTVCLVVLGQHARPLKFLSLLLGDQPALPPAVSYYQRLLAGDRKEATALAHDFVKTHSLNLIPDEVLIPALILARRDREHSGLTAADEAYILESTEAVVGELIAKARSPHAVDESAAPGTLSSLPLILACPAHHKADELAALAVGMVLDPSEARVEVLSTRSLPAQIEQRIEEDPPALLMIIVMPPGGITQTRYLCRRLRRKFADLPIVVGYFGKVRDFDKLLIRLRAAGATYVTTSVTQTQKQLISLLPAVAKVEKV